MLLPGGVSGLVAVAVIVTMLAVLLAEWEKHE
jgi:hypothetical protein